MIDLHLQTICTVFVLIISRSSMWDQGIIEGLTAIKIELSTVKNVVIRFKKI